MSALGQKRIFCDAGAMSALPSKADFVIAAAHAARNASPPAASQTWSLATPIYLFVFRRFSSIAGGGS